jgi:hypothetical protein
MPSRADAGLYRKIYRPSGGTGEGVWGRASRREIDGKVRQAQQFKQMYANPAINVAMTFAEVFPIGLVIAAVSAGILRKKAREP